LGELSHELLAACDPDIQIAKAKELFDLVDGAPSAAEISQAAAALTSAATAPFFKPALRRRLLEMCAQNEQFIDRHTIDEVLYAGFDAAAVAKARAKVADFHAWITAHKDEFTALPALYAGSRPLLLTLTLKDLKALRDALAEPPLAATPHQLWRAFEATEARQGSGTGGAVLTDLVALVHHALQPTAALTPFWEETLRRFRQWLAEREAGHPFSAEQRAWLERMAEHIATSLIITPQDFDAGWFGQQGSLRRAYLLFGDELDALLAELNERLVA